MDIMTNTLPIARLRDAFGEHLQENVSLSRYTAARVGGPADALVIVRSAAMLAEAVQRMWSWQVPFIILGGASNILVSDAGVREVVVINRARKVLFQDSLEPPTVWVESGANFGSIARQAAAKGLAGLAWAAGVPGTVGGAVVGNAGAHGGDMAGNLIMAEILHPTRGIEEWSVESLQYDYRGSALKRAEEKSVVLTATLRLERSTTEAVLQEMDGFLKFRRRTQPPGASMGSMFKNPPGDFAGRLIDAAGLKSKRIGDAQISPLHGNFFINLGEALAEDIWQLLCLARETVAEQFGVRLELEIDLVGDWSGYDLG